MSIHYGGRGPGHIARVQGGLQPVLNLDLTSALDSRITASGGANGTRVNSSGLIVAATTPRFDYDPATLAAKGVLIEEARTNLFTYSAEFDNVIWNKLRCSISANSVASPDGGTNADTLQEDGVASASSRRAGIDPTLSDSTTYTFSFYAKKKDFDYIAGYVVNKSGTVNGFTYFNINTGTLGNVTSGVTASIVSAGNGWYRCVLTYASETGATTAATYMTLAASNGSVTLNDTNTLGTYVWGAQLEPGAFATSYIPTAGSAVTRSADSLSMTGTNFSSWWNATEGTFYFEGDSPGSGTRPLVSADDNTANEKFNLYTSTLDPKFLITDGGVSQADIDAGSITANTAFKFAAAFKANDCSVSVNGGAEVNDTSATMPTVDRLRIGADQAGNSLNGHVKAFRFYSTNKDTQALTA